MEFWFRRFRIFGLWTLLLFGGWAASAQDFKGKVELAWGTDGPKPEGKDFKELDPKTREKLRQFRWKNYWIVKTESAVVKPAPTKLTLSAKCLVELKDLGNGNLEVRLYDLKAGAEPKFVKAVQHSIKALKDGEYCILAGDDKDKWDDAWFVIITAAKH